MDFENLPMESFEIQNPILEYLKNNPNSKSYEISNFLKIDRKVVNSFLYRSLNKHVTQDYNYRWKLIEKNKIENERFSKNDKDHKTDLSNLCNYYLSCLGYDEAGVSLSVKSKMDNQFFFETKSIPDNENIHEYEENLRLLSARKRTEIGRHELFFGYPSFINKIFLIKENFTKKFRTINFISSRF